MNHDSYTGSTASSKSPLVERASSAALGDRLSSIAEIPSGRSKPVAGSLFHCALYTPFPVFRKARVREIALLIGQPGEFRLRFAEDHRATVHTAATNTNTPSAVAAQSSHAVVTSAVRCSVSPRSRRSECAAHDFNGKRQIAGRLEAPLDILFQTSAENPLQCERTLPACAFVPVALRAKSRSSFSRGRVPFEGLFAGEHFIQTAPKLKISARGR